MKPGSCRSGVVVHFLAETGAQVPVRLAVHTKQVDVQGAPPVTMHVVKVRGAGEQAERRGQGGAGRQLDGALLLSMASVSHMRCLVNSQVTKVTAEEVLAEKRITLTLDFAGRVTEAAPLDSTLFNFPARELLGVGVWDFCDMFAEWWVSVHPTGRRAGGRAGSKRLSTSYYRNTF